MPGWWNGDDDNDGKSNREERQIEREENREEQRDREVERWKKQMERDEKKREEEKNKKKREERRGGGGNIPGVPTPIEPPAQQQSEDYSKQAAAGLLPSVPDFNKLVSSIRSGSNPTATFWAVVVLGWVLFGIAGFVMSLWCIGFTGNFGEKVIGVIIAMILGPWYWLYFYSVPTYCARLPPPSLF